MNGYGKERKPNTNPSPRRKAKKLEATVVVSAPAEGTSVAATKKQKKPKEITVRRVKSAPDYIILSIVIVLSIIGLITVFSASYAYSYTMYDDSYFYVKSQAKYLAIGLVALFSLTYIPFFDYDHIRRLTPLIYIVTLGLLGAVLVYGLAVGEAQRWINVPFIGSIQPSEIAKFAVVVILALYVSKNENRITNYANAGQSILYGIIFPGIVLGIPCVLILAENHFSGVLIVFAIGAVIIFTSGARKDVLAAIVIAALIVVLVFILLTPYARTRIDMFLNPDNYDPKGTIWQTLQGLYAIGSGGIFGVGLGNSKQKYLFVSQPQNDFIFSIFCEEMGFAGAIVVIALFAFLIYRGIVVALRAPDTFSSLTALGITSKLAIQTILNIAVVSNLVPNTGISLPFFSSGGTALIVQLAEMGVLLGISRYTYAERNKDAVEPADTAKINANT